VDDYVQLDRELEKARDAKQLSFIEVKCAIGSRPDLGRPTLTAKENKENFVEYIRRNKDNC
jgi:phosphonopyruvate decarboxylase